jgi:dihydroorotate dehydrogenase
VFIDDGDTPWVDSEHVDMVTGSVKAWPKNFRSFSTANSVGVPSVHPNQWRANFERSLGVLKPGQILILSVMGTSGLTDRNLIEDFVEVAKLAEAAGAEFIELNLSCPNTIDTSSPSGTQRPVCESPGPTLEIVDAVRQAVDAKLVAKLSYLEPGLLEDVVGPLLSMVDAISGINTLQKSVVDSDTRKPLFVGTAEDENAIRDPAGVSGAVIRNLGLEFVRGVRSLSSRQTVDIIGIGGVMTGDDYAAYRDRGADAVQVATGALVNTRLPSEVAEIEPSPLTRPSESKRELLRRGIASGGLSLITGYSS